MSIFSFFIYLQYFNQILTAVLEVLDDADSSVREVALSLINEMLKNQVCAYEYVRFPFCPMISLSKFFPFCHAYRKMSWKILSR